MTDESSVRGFYSGKNIFITGGTGFVGLCLIEKILRSIPDVGKLYLLMRPKKGKQISERLEEFPKNAVFEKLLETDEEETQSSDVFKKLIAISGDVGEPDLGLSAEDRKLLIDNVNVVIHSAATLDFQENLKPTVNINLLGTRRIMELCEQMKNLKVMVHVSSAYVNSFMTEVQENIYEAPEDAEKVIKFVETLSDEALGEIEPKLLRNHPNTYTFTKHLAEHEVLRCADKFPCTIVRPTMIVAAWKEPVPGWTCSKVGPQGFLMGASKGVVRRLPLAVNNIADYIPVDIVVNQLLVAGWDAATHKSGITVYHCSSSTQNPFTWKSIEGHINSMLHKYPLKSAVWYPHLKFVNSLWLFKLSAIFVHFFPGFLLDMMLRVTGGRPILIRLHKNVWSSLNRLERFIFTEWKFYNLKTINLAAKLGEKDRELFNIDISDLVWDSYFVNLHLGVRRYLNRESEKTLPAAKNKDLMLLAAHCIWQVLLMYGLWHVVAFLMGLDLTQSAWCVPILYILYNML